MHRVRWKVQTAYCLSLWIKHAWQMAIFRYVKCSAAGDLDLHQHQKQHTYIYRFQMKVLFVIAQIVSLFCSLKWNLLSCAEETADVFPYSTYTVRVTAFWASTTAEYQCPLIHCRHSISITGTASSMPSKLLQSMSNNHKSYRAEVVVGWVTIMSI